MDLLSGFADDPYSYILVLFYKSSLIVSLNFSLRRTRRYILAGLPQCTISCWRIAFFPAIELFRREIRRASDKGKHIQSTNGTE